MKRALLSMLCALGMLVGMTSLASAQMVTNGAVKLGWNYRGGNCTIRYTEVGQQAYKYMTTTGCNDGGIIIGGLVPGQKYKFQVSPDGVNWSKPVASMAKTWTGSNVVGEVVNGDGAVHLMWNQRGGTCAVRYTEANQRVYKYFTQTNCDDGQIVIGSLITGRKYRFQVSQNGMGWSRPIVARAQGMMIAAAPSVGTVTTTIAAVNGNGTVRVNWDMRGGVCNVRYSEANAGGYNYSTSAGCDDGGVTIGSLVVGRRYKFEVAQNNWSSWSRPVKGIAR